MTLTQGRDKRLDNGQQLSEILSRSNMTVRCYGPDNDFVYMCTQRHLPLRDDLGSRS